MFQSSKHVPADSHIRLLEAAGASDLNGTTDYDRTNYFETVPSNQVELALWLESDRMGYLLEKVDQAALSNQQDVVRNERRQSVENEPYGLAEETLIQSLFPAGHPYYGNVIGSHEDIQAAKLDDVKRFFRQYYAPNNASLAIVGDFEPAQMKALVQKYFGTLKRGPAVPPIKAETPKITVRAPQGRDRSRRAAAGVHGVADLADPEARRRRCRHRRDDPRRRALEPSVQEARLREADRPGRDGAAVLADARIDLPDPGHGSSGTHGGGAGEGLEEELSVFRSTPTDAREIERARNMIETNIIGGLERLGGFGGIADRLNSYNHYLGNPDYLQQDIQRYRGVTASTLQTFARDQLAPTARVVMHVVPGEPAAQPQVATPPASKAAAGEGSESINADEPWRNEMPKPAAARPLQLATPMSETLPNGLTLILNERRGLPIVAANLVLRTGSDANPLDKPGLANFTAAMLDEGTATRNALQIADEVAQLGASLGISSSMDATTLSVRSLSKNFAATVDLLADVTLRPSFPAQEIERQRASRLAQLVQQRDNPNQVAAQVTASALYGPQHPYGYSEIGTEAALKSVVARRHGGVLEAELRAEQRGARRRRRYLDERAEGAGGKGLRRLAARHAGTAGARRARRRRRPAS